MMTASAATTLRTTEIIAEECPQCGHGEAVCEIRGVGAAWRYTTCPRCGFAAQTGAGCQQEWRGHGVYVLQEAPGSILAGTFPRAIPDERVPSLRARFQALGPVVRYVSRWNEHERRLEVLLSTDS